MLLKPILAAAIRSKGGRPAKLSPKEIKTIRALLKTADIAVCEIAARFGIARSSLYRSVLKSVALETGVVHNSGVRSD